MTLPITPFLAIWLKECRCIATQWIIGDSQTKTASQKAKEMVVRSNDVTKFNAVINHPSVHPWVSKTEQELDASDVIADRRNILLEAPHGFFIFHFHEPGTYEVHTQFLPEGRGKNAFISAKEASHYMFTKTDCVEILTKVPVENVAAKKLTTAMGFTQLFTGSKWKEKPVEFFRLGIEEWMANAPRLVEKGDWFHHELLRQGAEADHEDDPVHDRYVGAAVEMILAGQVGKGIVYYNRWARFYGYETIQCVSETPLVIDIRTAKLAVGNGSFEVIETCQ